jgi:hypothetical protein
MGIEGDWVKTGGPMHADIRGVRITGLYWSIVKR